MPYIPFFGEPGFPAPLPDEHFASVSLLLRFNGTNDSQDFVDESTHGHTVGFVGDPRIRTDVWRFGGGSARLTPGSALTVAHHTSLDVSTGDFTVDLWAKRSPSSGGGAIYVNKAAGTSYYPLQVWIDASGRFGFRGFSAGEALVFSMLATDPVADYGWHYLRGVRAGSDFIFTVDGSVQGSASFSGALFSSSAPVSVGGYSTGAGSSYDHLDDVRITKGVARSTGAHAVPLEAAPFGP